MDDVKKPLHYNKTQIETIDIMDDYALLKFGSSGLICVYWYAIFKYLHRFPDKEPIKDLEKAQWYLDRLIKLLKEGHEHIAKKSLKRVLLDDGFTLEEIQSMIDESILSDSRFNNIKIGVK